MTGPAHEIDEEAWMRELEDSPEFIASQLRAGHVLTDRDVEAISKLLSEIDKRENESVEAFQQGRLAGFREIGGEDLVTSVLLKDEEHIARTVRDTMDRLFPKNRRVQ